MPKCNFLFFINAYNDLQQTTAPALNNFKWSREINGVPYTIEKSQQLQVPITTTSANLVTSAASFIYLESDVQVSVIYNGGTAMVLTPFQIDGRTQPAVFFMAGPATSLTDRKSTRLNSSHANI